MGNSARALASPSRFRSSVGLAHPAEELVPAAPARLERASRACARARAELVGEGFEQAVRLVAERDAHALELEPRPGLERCLEPRLDFDLDVFAMAAQVHDAGGEAALEQTREARAARAARHRDEVRLVPAHAIGRRRPDAVMHAAQPGAGGERGLARVVERAARAERPGLPAVAEEAQLGAGADPAEAQHDGFEVDRCSRPIGDHAIEARGLVRRVERDSDREGPEHLHARRERAFDPEQRAERAVVATLR